MAYIALLFVCSCLVAQLDALRGGFLRRTTLSETIAIQRLAATRSISHRSSSCSFYATITEYGDADDLQNEVLDIIGSLVGGREQVEPVLDGIVMTQVYDKYNVDVRLKAGTDTKVKNMLIMNLSTKEWANEIRVNFGLGESEFSHTINNQTKIEGVRAELRNTSPPAPVEEIINGLSNVKKVIAVSSCKGGVGKSTTSVNFAYTLSKLGYKVGILDADIYGPSLPTMTSPESLEFRTTGSNQLKPLVYEGVKLMSMGFLNKGAAIMRGPMVNQILTQFVTLTDWGELDYLVLDMPPGTGDIQLTLAQVMSIDAAVVVTTPQRLSFIDVVKGIDMFDTVNIPSVAIVENMASIDAYEFDNDYFGNVTKEILDLSKKGELTADALFSYIKTSVEARKKPSRVFGVGHIDRVRNMWGIENIISVPVQDEVSAAGDKGVPFVLTHPESITAIQMKELVTKVISELKKLESDSEQNAYDISFDETSGKIIFKSPEALGIQEEVNPKSLRCDCRCALCVEEMTGAALLDPDSVPGDIRPVSMAPIGRYAMSVDWSDSHKSLYPFKQIERLVTAVKK
jgi:Mrp family chromosome partitioning ATPase